MENKNDDVIELNVGGQTMTTKRSTLCQVEGSLLASMFGGRWKGNMSRDKDDRIFLDFNPKYFGFILDYLRAKAISITGRPAKLPKVDSDEVNNFYELVEYLGLGREMLPPVSESFKEHSPGYTLEENGTVAAYHSKSRTQTNRYKTPTLIYSEPQNEFIFGKNVYEGGIIRLRLKIEVKYIEHQEPGHIWVGVVPSEVTPELAKRTTYFRFPEGNFYGWKMDCDHEVIKIPVESRNGPWYYSSPTTIEVILDCDTRVLYLKFHDGKQLNLKVTRWNRWRLLVKLSSRNPNPVLEWGGPLPISAVVSAHIVDSEEECTLKCLEELYCLGFNYNARMTNKNCQLTGERWENMEVMNGNDWIFYQVLSTDEKKNCNTTEMKVPKPVDVVYRYERQSCTCNWKKFDGRCYYISEKATTSWYAARADCHARGGDLVVPESGENTRNIYEAMKERSINRVWIGVYRGTGNLSNKFYTVRDVEVSYTNWSDGEPSNLGGHEDCVELWYPEKWSFFGDGDNGWNDLPCSNFTRHFICEQNL